MLSWAWRCCWARAHRRAGVVDAVIHLGPVRTQVPWERVTDAEYTIMTHHQLIRTSPAEANIALLIDADNAPVYGFRSSNTFP
jgi:hypothetical protein